MRTPDIHTNWFHQQKQALRVLRRSGEKKRITSDASEVSEPRGEPRITADRDSGYTPRSNK